MTKSDPAWLRSMKKEADKLGIPLRELLTKSLKPEAKAKAKTMKAAMGGMPMAMKNGKKVPAFAADGVGKMMKGGMAKKKPAAKMMAGGMGKKSGYMYGGMANKPAAKKK